MALNSLNIAACCGLCSRTSSLVAVGHLSCFWQLPSVDREGKALIDPTSVIAAEPGAVF